MEDEEVDGEEEEEEEEEAVQRKTETRQVRGLFGASLDTALP
jgi:hypothetical protein